MAVAVEELRQPVVVEESTAKKIGRYAARGRSTWSCCSSG